jgi:hypothetical protein
VFHSQFIPDTNSFSELAGSLFFAFVEIPEWERELQVCNYTAFPWYAAIVYRIVAAFSSVPKK